MRFLTQEQEREDALESMVDGGSVCGIVCLGRELRIIQLMLGHASIQQTQRYLNVTDEELRRGLEVSWINRSRALRAVSGS